MKNTIERISADSKETLIKKIKNRDFSFLDSDKVRAAIINSPEFNLEDFIMGVDELFQKNQEKDYFTDSDFYFYSGTRQSKIAFLFPGQGSQYPGMGKEIKEILDRDLHKRADEIFSENSAFDSGISEIIFPPVTTGDNPDKNSEKRLQQTDAAQPAIGLTSALYASLLNKLNVKAAAASGHSFGEISALYYGGAIDFNTFIRLSSTRGKLMAECGKNRDAGSMMAVLGTIEKIEEIIKNENLKLTLANKNSPKQNVVSGETAEIEKAVKIFRKYKLRGIKLPVAAAFHSPLVEDAAIPFSEFMNHLKIDFPEIPVTSNTTGGFHEKDTIKELLSKQLTSPVLFTENIKVLFDSGIQTFIEVGPKKVLTDLAKQSAPKNKNFWFASVDASSGKSPLKDISKILSLLFVLGFGPDIETWNSF